ncbi:hypothetical protein ACFLYH_00650 [Candidatus Dependentiae bacterium]
MTTNLTVNILPCLDQKKSEKDHTNYCGYYALYNSKHLLEGSTQNLLIRKSFTDFFKNALEKVGVKTNYDNLSESELQKLIKQFSLKNLYVIPMKSFFEYVSSDFALPLSAILENGQATKNALKDFASKKIKILTFVAGLAYSGGHWVAMRISRMSKNDITIDVADSLHKVSWYTRNLVISRIIPFYFAALGKWDKDLWKEIVKLNGLSKKVTIKV